MNLPARTSEIGCSGVRLVAGAAGGTASAAPWQMERAKRLHVICGHVAARVQRGEKIGRALKVFARRWDGKPFTTRRGKCLALSTTTLRRLYAVWRKGGRCTAVFRMGYRPGLPKKATPELVNEFRALCRAPGITSMMAAYRKLPQKDRVSYRSLTRVLPAGERRALRMLYRLRVQQRQVMEELGKTKTTVNGE
jgi:hypothetical protein